MLLWYNIFILPDQDKSVNDVQGNNRCLFYGPYKTHKHTQCEQNVELHTVKHGATYSSNH